MTVKTFVNRLVRISGVEVRANRQEVTVLLEGVGAEQFGTDAITIEAKLPITYAEGMIRAVGHLWRFTLTDEEPT